MEICERYDKVAAKIANKARLVAVSKTKPSSQIRLLNQHGVKDFGENKVQELDIKASELSDLPLSWHFIGQLQSNKIKQLLKIPQLEYIHSISSSKLLSLLYKNEGLLSHPLSFFLQVNTSGELEKGGFESFEQLCESIDFIQSQKSSSLKLCGLMTMGKIRTDNFIQSAHSSFSLLQSFQSQLNSKYNLDLKLSMGMSQDYHIALEYQSDYVRVGSEIFGARSI